MLLQRLHEYATERMHLPPTLYSDTPVRYIIFLDLDGRYLDMVDTADDKNKRGKRRLAPQVQRAAGIKPLLLADKADYTLGFIGEDAKANRVKETHEAYLKLLERCAEVTQDTAVKVVLRFLQNDPLSKMKLPEKFDSGAMITFQVGLDDGNYPIYQPSVQAFWAAENNPEAKGATVMQCLVCGKERPVLSRLLGKIKGIPGGQTAGTSLISANAPAFESYGLKESLIAPTCAECGEQFTKAANSLLINEERQSSLIVGGAAFIYWTREKVEFDFFGYIKAPDPQQVRKLLQSVFSGERQRNFDETAFYGATLSASGARTVVRDWIDTTVGTAQIKLAEWFLFQRIVDRNGEEAAPLGIFPLAAATVRDASKDLAPPTTRVLLRSALTGTPLPYDLLNQAVRRNRGEQDVTRPRAALIKLILSSRAMLNNVQSRSDKEDYMVQLEMDNLDSAYLCGRLLAVLERAQDVALNNPKAGIVNRFYGTASSAPASVFPRLLRGVRAHLTKLERDNPGAYHKIQNSLEEIISNIANLPTVLNLHKQGLFALGYYHQRAHDRKQANETWKSKKVEQDAVTHDKT